MTGFQPPRIALLPPQHRRLPAAGHAWRARHYSFEPENAATGVNRWSVLDVSMPAIFRPLRRLIVTSFDKENPRTMAAVNKYAEAHTRCS